MNTRINKVIIYKLTLLFLLIIFISISGCSLIGLEPSDEIVQEAVHVCANSCTPPAVDASGASGQALWFGLCKMRGEARITDFKITNNWKKTINNETVFFYETQFKMIYSKVDVGNLHYEKSCYSSVATVQLVKRGKKWYSLTSNCADQRSEVECGNDTSETVNSSAPKPVQTPSENQKEDPCKEVYKFYSDCVEEGDADHYPSSHVDDRNFSYYSSVYDRKNFYNVCTTSINNKKIIDYSSFKKTVCKEVKEAPPIEGTPAKGTLVKDIGKIQTSFGTVTLQKVEEVSYVMLQGKKVYTIKDPGDRPDFSKNSFKVGYDNLFFINTGAGNSAEWSYMLVERKDGLFISDPQANEGLPYIGDDARGLYINGDKFIIIESMKYGKHKIITYKNGMLTQKGDYNEKDFDFDIDKIKQIKLIKIY